MKAAHRCCESVGVDAGAGVGVGDDVDDSRSAWAVMRSYQEGLCRLATGGNDYSIRGVGIRELQEKKC